MMTGRTMRIAFFIGFGLLSGCLSRTAQGADNPAPQPPRRIAAGVCTVIDPHPDRIVLQRDAYTLVYDSNWRIPAWAAYQANPRTRLPGDSPLPPERVVADQQVANALSPAEALEQLPELGFHMVRLVPATWLGGQHPRRYPGLPTAEQANLTSNLVPMLVGGAVSAEELWTGVQQWIEQLVETHDVQLSVIAGCIVDRELAQRVGPRKDVFLPSHYFVVLLHQAERNGPVEAIAFLFPQRPAPFAAIGSYLSSIDAIERLSGLRLLAAQETPRITPVRPAPPGPAISPLRPVRPAPDVPSAPRWEPWRGPAPPAGEMAREGGPTAAPSHQMSRQPTFRFDLPDGPGIDGVAEESAPAPMPAAPMPAAPAPSESIPAPAPSTDPFTEAPAPPAPDTPDAPDAPETVAVSDRLVRVFYGTDRTPTGIVQPNDFYGSEPAEELTLGVCDVSIPPVHVQGSGELERPWPLMSEDPDRHVMLLAIEVLEQEQFVAQLQAAMLRAAEETPAGQRPAFVFIHGYNNSFADAARRTAQMAFDLNLDIVPIMYSWPSRGQWWEYARDRRQFNASVPHLSEFLRLVRDQCQVDKLHIICHSMGSDLFQQTLDQLAASEPRGRIDQIILAAPDINATVFRKEIAEKIEKLGTRVTIYVSSRDRALLASQYANRDGEPRLGFRAWDDLHRFAKIDQVDVTSVDTSVVGHLYYGGNSGILTDIRAVLDGADAAGRHLVRVGPYYVFPAPGFVHVDWDLRRGWEWSAFQQGWEVLLDRKVVLLLGLGLLTIVFMRWRISRLRRALRRHPG
jgi:esterase/lipase superfamily enzyme